ncbi:MAG: hypothetical protein LBH87_01805 [Coriobacteriales bacterium]|nr:hypothetical protein [Coriobacteriales bacterium]
MFNDILKSVMPFLIVVIIVIGLLYLLSVIWVIRDAYLRGANPIVWGLIALIPFIGVFAYTILRPPMLLSDHDEQDLDFTLKQRELMKYGECASCGYPVEREYLMCPHCASPLKNECKICGHALDPDWKVCPFCCQPQKN